MLESSSEFLIPSPLDGLENSRNGLELPPPPLIFPCSKGRGRSSNLKAQNLAYFEAMLGHPLLSPAPQPDCPQSEEKFGNCTQSKGIPNISIRILLVSPIPQTFLRQANTIHLYLELGYYSPGCPQIWGPSALALLVLEKQVGGHSD